MDFPLKLTPMVQLGNRTRRMPYAHETLIRCVQVIIDFTIIFWRHSLLNKKYVVGSTDAEREGLNVYVRSGAKSLKTSISAILEWTLHFVSVVLIF